MPVVDVLNKQAQLKIHRWPFTLWPQLWRAYSLPDSFNWEIYPFQRNQIGNIPSQPGIYSFVIQSGIASHPHGSYLMYIGKAERTLQVRFREYLREQNNPEGRPKILELLNLYQGYLHFCCSIIQDKARIPAIEGALINAFRPPCNDQIPAETSRVQGGFNEKNK